MQDTSMRTVTQAYERVYAEPIRLSQGDRVRVTKEDTWDQVHIWLWCIDERGQEGWVPQAWLERNGDEAVATRDYHAAELTVREGEMVCVLDETSGWYWCENAAGDQGWVPITHVSDSAVS
jgi:SH3-like domain-containing protein